MTKTEAKKIIEIEGLTNYNWCDEREIRPGEVVIKKDNGQWIVYTADERAVIKSELSYPTEREALEDFIERLRADKILRELKKINNRELVTYKGRNYCFKNGVDHNNIVLISYNQSDKLLGFSPSLKNNGVFLKEISKDEVENAFYVIPRAIYKGAEFAVSDGNNGKALLDTGDAQLAKQFHFERTDKYMYSKYVEWHEIEIKEEVKPLSI